MNCYECGSRGVAEAAVGACVNCGAGVCADHAHPEEQFGTMSGNSIRFMPTRKLFCVTCDDALAHRPVHSAR
jgi:hypothetical protein